MKTSFLSSAYRGPVTLPLDEVIPAVAAAGLDAIEITAEGFGRNRHAGLDFTTQELERARELCERFGLHVSAVSAHFPLTSISEEKRAFYLAEYKASIDQAVVLGTDFVHGYSGTLPRPVLWDEDEDRIWQVFREQLIAVLDYAAERGVKFGIEPVITMLVRDYATCQRMFELVDRDDLYLNYDPAHLYCCGSMTDAVRVIRDFGSRIRHVHAHDAVGEGYFDWKAYRRVLLFDWSKPFRPTFMGEIQWDTVLRELRAVGYDGYLSYEYPVGYVESYKYYIGYAAMHYNSRMKELIGRTGLS